MNSLPPPGNIRIPCRGWMLNQVSQWEQDSGQTWRIRKFWSVARQPLMQSFKKDENSALAKNLR